MNLFESLSTKKFQLTGNIDDRYFKQNDDGTYSATPLFIYNVARDVANDIKSIIIHSDDPAYVNHTNNDGKGYDENDSWAKHEHDAAWNVKYKDQIEAVNKKWKEYREAHPDEFDQNAPTVATGDIPTTRFFSAYHPDFSGLSNAELMSMYKEALELGKRFDNKGDLRENLPLRPGNYRSKQEFDKEHKRIKKEIEMEVGLPEDTWECPKVHKDDRTSIIRSNSKAFKAIQNADGSAFDDYVNGLIDHITGSTPEAYQKEWEELYTNIEDVCNNLERGGRGTKLVISKSNAKQSMNVSIYTADKGDGVTRRRLAKICKQEPTDAFYTFTLFITSGGKRPVRQIATKADLRKTFEDLIEVLNDNDLSEYVDCVQNAIDSIL